MALQLYKIAAVEVGSAGASSIDFTSIPSGYTDLVVKLSLRADAVVSLLKMNINSSSANFTRKQLEGSGTAAASGSGSDNYIGYIDYSTLTANTFSNTEVYIPNYASSNFKSISTDSVQENNATAAYSSLFASLWSQTAAITSLSFNLASANFVQYSTATLYGIL